MAALFAFGIDYSTASAPPERGAQRISGQTNLNWKNLDDPTASYASYPVTANTNSFDMFLFGIFSGTFNSISTVKWQHTGGNMGAGISLMFGTGSSGFYRTPAITTNSALTLDLTSTGSISSGINLYVGTVGPEQTGKNASSPGNPLYTMYIASQLVTTSSAQAGDFSSPAVFQLQYLEN